MSRTQTSRVIIHTLDGVPEGCFHKIIYKDGTIASDIDISLVGNHSFNRNEDSIGIALKGDTDIRPPLLHQIHSLEALYHGLCRYYSTNLEIEFCSENCPGKLFNRKHIYFILHSCRPY